MRRVHRALAALVMAAASAAGCASVLGDDYEFVECPAPAPPTQPSLVCDTESTSDDACSACITCTSDCMCAALFDACSSTRLPCQPLYDCIDVCLEKFPEPGPDFTGCDADCENMYPDAVAPHNARLACWGRECPVACN